MDHDGRREYAVQHSGDPDVPGDLRIQEPQPAIDRSDRRYEDQRPCARGEVTREQRPEEREPSQVERGVTDIQMDQVRRQQAPPFPCADRSAVILQKLNGGRAGELQGKHQSTGGEERRAILAVAVERSEADPDSQAISRTWIGARP